jgi:hypothetical protein
MNFLLTRVTQTKPGLNGGRHMKPGIAAISIALLFNIFLLQVIQVKAEINTDSSALELARAMATEKSLVTGASFISKPPFGTPTAVSNTPLTRFPTAGPTYTILSTGDATFAPNPNSDGETTGNNHGGPVRGATDMDVVILKIDLKIPAGANCLSFNFQFFSEEYPEWVGTQFNDAFIAELDTSTWTTTSETIDEQTKTTIIAPDNYAFDQQGNVISINATGYSSVSAANALGTTYDSATPLLRASTQVTPGVHSLYLSIFDQVDTDFDSAVFIDSLVAHLAPSEYCVNGLVTAKAPVEVSQPDMVMQLRTEPNIAAPLSTPDNRSVVTHTLAVKNLGPGKADSFKVDFPVDPNLEVLSVAFEPAGNPASWVTEVTTDSIKLQMGAFPGFNNAISHTITATIRLGVKLEAPSDTAINTRARGYAAWSGGPNLTTKSNSISYKLGPQNQTDNTGDAIQHVSATIDPATKSVIITGDIFIPNEKITGWINLPGGTVKAITGGLGNASTFGLVKAVYNLEGLDPGDYSIVLYGARSEVQGVAHFTVSA